MEYLKKTITLPVSGLEAVIREADSHAEDLLFRKGLERIHFALPGYWAYLTVRMGDKEPVTEADILNLVLPDQHFLAIEIYRLTYGDILRLSGAAGRGGNAGYEYDLTNLDLVPLPEGACGPDPEFTFTLPRTGHVVDYGYLTGKQEIEELNLDDFSLGRLEFRAIRRVDGAPAKLADVQSWPMIDHIALRKDMESKRCGLDTRVRFTDDRGVAVVRDLLLDPSFLAPGLRSG